MDRREFCVLAGGCALCAAAGGLAGCARLLDSSGRGAKTESMSVETSAPRTAGAAVGHPDLAVWKGSNPAANVRAAVDALGGMERFVKQDNLVVLKPNVLTGRPPEYATTTNPQVVAAVVAMCLEAGARDVVVVDRPTSEARPAFDTAGLTQAVAAAGGRVKFLTDRNFEEVAIPKGRAITSRPICTDVFEADTFINMPIAKTHVMCGLTMAMKNLMGVLGGERGTMHQDFDQKIVDLNTVVKPHLVILDAHRMLWRNGPTGGDLADVKLAQTVVAGTGQVEVDAFGCTLFDWEPKRLTYLRLADKQGLGELDLSRLSIARGQA